MADEESVPETGADRPARTNREQVFSRETYSGGSPLEQMILALSDEIEFADQNAKKQTLKNGERSGEMGGLSLYTFPLEHGFDFEADEDVAVAIGGRDYRGRVIRVDLAVVVIGIDGDQGAVLTRVDVTKADNVLDRLLRKQLVDVFDGHAGFHKKQAELAIGVGDVVVTTSPIPELVDRYLSAPGKGFKLNPGQETFLEQAIASELTLLWGPPGCGKTMGIGLLAACLIDQGKRVLLASNTNKAVDGALKEVLKTQQIIRALDDERSIVRFGGAGITEEFKRDWPEHLFEAILHSRGEVLEAEKVELSTEQALLSDKLSRCEQRLSDYEDHRRTRKHLDTLPADIRDAETDLAKLRGEASELEQRRRELEAEWGNAPEHATLTTRLTGKRIRDVVEADRKNCQVKIGSIQDAIAKQGQGLTELKHEQSRQEEWLEELSTRLKAHPPEATLKSDQNDIRSRLSEIEARLREINKALADLARSILSEATLVGTTVHKIFLDPILSRLDFDVVVVDEASMVILPMIYWAAGRAKSQVVVVGDFRQLPAIVKNPNSDLVREWVAGTPFDKWKVRDAVREGRASDLAFLVALQEQNRMHPEIGQLVSDLFYFDIHTARGKGLLPGSEAISQSATLQRLPAQHTDKRIVTIDTRELGAWSSLPFGGKGRFNPTHVALGLALIDRLALAGLLKEGGQEQIGYVTPYAGQAHLFAQAAKGRHGAFIDDTSIGTAHRFQGGERDIMIFDYVLSESRHRPSRFIDSETGEDQPANLLNVALSRAKKHLILIYNSVEFGERNTYPWMRRFFETLEQRAEPLDARALLQESDILGKVRELSMGRSFSVKDGNTLHNETSFYGAVRRDLDTARKSVTIFSAFATPDNVGRWAELFRSLLERSVRIRIVTKPPRRQPNAERYGDQLKGMFDTLRRAGIVLDTRTVTHEKVVVIDETIVWHGSLNMLSQNVERTTEVMTRTVSADYARELLQMLARHDLKQKDLSLPQMPSCPTCGGPTSLATNWKGNHSLFCEQDCGFVAGAWDFYKLMRGIPIGRHLHSCPECKGVVVVAQTPRGGTYARCNARSPRCNHREDLRLGDLAPYDPFPTPAPATPTILDDLAAQAAPFPDTADTAGDGLQEPHNDRFRQEAPKKRQTRAATDAPHEPRPHRQSDLQGTKERDAGRSRARPRTVEELDDFLSSLE